LDPAALILVGLLAAVVVSALLYGVVAAGARRRNQGASLSAIDFARASFARQLNIGVPLVENLLQLVEALRDTFKLEGAELWLCESGTLRLAASEPRRQRPPAPITKAEESIVANATVSSATWAKVWLPALLDGRADRQLRVAPVSHAGQLFGLIVAERARNADRLAGEADVTLEEVAREVGVALNKARLDAALQESLQQLRVKAAELQASRTRLVAAADEERRRIERNLHDGAQQHLVALAVKVRLLEQVSEKDPERARTLMDQLQDDVKAAVDELRALAHGIYPPLLSSRGLGEALTAAGRRASLPAHVEANGLGRYTPEVEAAVYFCCVEALQNAGKHAGSGASAGIRLWQEEGMLHFEVADDGSGFESNGQSAGAGLTNMRDRLGAVGGTITVESAPGKGTRLCGTVPLGAEPIT
jgi:signal transduction histidine kinase